MTQTRYIDISRHQPRELQHHPQSGGIDGLALKAACQTLNLKPDHIEAHSSPERAIHLARLKGRIAANAHFSEAHREHAERLGIPLLEVQRTSPNTISIWTSWQQEPTLPQGTKPHTSRVRSAGARLLGGRGEVHELVDLLQPGLQQLAREIDEQIMKDPDTGRRDNQEYFSYRARGRWGMQYARLIPTPGDKPHLKLRLKLNHDLIDMDKRMRDMSDSTNMENLEIRIENRDDLKDLDTLIDLARLHEIKISSQ